MKDKFENEIEVGDIIVYAARLRRNQIGLKKARVTEIRQTFKEARPWRNTADKIVESMSVTVLDKYPYGTSLKNTAGIMVVEKYKKAG